MSRVDRSRLPSPGPDPVFRFPSATKQRLPNGLSLWTVERRALPIVSLVVMLPAGSVLDPGNRPGLASLTADMLDEGSGDRSAIEMQMALAGIGAELDTETGPDAVMLSLTLVERFVPQGLQLLAEIVARPRLDRPDFDRVRTLRANRIRQLRDVPGVNADVVFAQALYGPHPYGHLAIGTSASLAAVDDGEVRAFHASHYDPARATLVAVGATDAGAFRRQAEEAFGSWARDASATPIAGNEPAAGPPEHTPSRNGAARLFVVDRPGAAQTELRIGHLGVPRRTDDFHALVLLNAVLGGHFSSRLNLNLRERRGYTYGVRSAFDFRRTAGPFSVQTSVQTDATADAIAQVLAELHAIRGERPVSDDERALSASTLTKGHPRSFETAGQVARGLAQLALYELPDDTFAAFGPRIQALAPRDLTRAAHFRLHPDEAVVVAVGDCARIGDDLEAIGMGEPVTASVDL